MTNTETTSQPQLIAASKLEKSPLNARRTVAQTGIEELKASILSHGLMQNLVVTDAGDGMFHVIAGGRRLEAIRSLQSEGKLPQDFAVPCQIVAEESAPEMSLAENVVRLAMHPADQFEAFAELIDKGHTAAEVAVRFGVEESLIHKRMKLARVAPELFEEYRNESMTLECLTAFTVIDDHQRQLKVYNSLQGWQKDDPGTIRDALTEKMVEASDKLVRFVGLEAYTAAGGLTRADLFGEEIYLEHPNLLHDLTNQKFDGIRRELEAEGWGWIEINSERDYSSISRYTRLRPLLIDAPAELLELKTRLDDELDAVERLLDETEEGSREADGLLDKQESIRQHQEELDERLAAYVGFDAEQKLLAGCFVSISHDGTPFIDKGLVKPEHRKQLAGLMGEAGDASPMKVKPKHPLSVSLRRDLAAARLQVAQVELAKHPAIAVDLLMFQIAQSMLGDTHFGDDEADVPFGRTRRSRLDDMESTIAGDAFASIADALPVEWLRLESEADRFEAFRSLSDTAKRELLAYCAALRLQLNLAPTAGENVTADEVALSLTSGDVAAFWRPTSENYLSRITREQLLVIGRDVLGESWSQSRAKDKKALLVGQLHRAFANPEKSGRTPEQIGRLKHWLPAGMGFGIPVPAELAKISQAA